MPYRSVRKKKEHNKKYYACNFEQLKTSLFLKSLYEEDPGRTCQPQKCIPWTKHSLDFVSFPWTCVVNDAK